MYEDLWEYTWRYTIHRLNISQKEVRILIWTGFTGNNGKIQRSTRRYRGCTGRYLACTGKYWHIQGNIGMYGKILQCTRKLSMYRKKLDPYLPQEDIAVQIFGVVYFLMKP